MRWTGPKEIKQVVWRILEERALELKGRRALDFPAGNGVTSAHLKNLGAEVVAIDLFPELFRVEGLFAQHGDLSDRFQVESNSIDFAVCQEGIEHVGGQDHVFSEFARVVKPGGTLLLTTPNYSSLKAKLSYLLTESESFGRIMPPNERDSVWISKSVEDGDIAPRVYYGHCFLTGFFRLRLFAKLAGWRFVQIHDSRVNFTSLLLLVIFYPFIFLFSLRTALRFFIKQRDSGGLALELFRFMVHPKLLLENHLVLEFQLPLTATDSLREHDISSFVT